MTHVIRRSALAALAALSIAASTHAQPSPAQSPLPAGTSPAEAAAANARARMASPPARIARPTQRIKAATSLPTLAEVARRAGRPGTAAGPDTFLVSSSSFDVISGGCDPRGWKSEDLVERVFAHVSERYKVNRDIFSWRRSESPPVFPAAIAGTPITAPRHVAANDSGMVFYVEYLNDGARIVAVYPGQNVMRTYADLPTYPGVDRGFHIAYSKTTGGLIVGSAYGNGAGAGLLYHVPAGGGTPVEIAGRGFTLNDAPAHDAALAVPEEIVTDADGNIYFCEIGQPPSEWPRVRMLRAADSTIVTLAGRLFYFDDTGDGGPGTSASLMFPRGLAINAAEDTLYILDALANRVRTLSLGTGIIDALPGAQYDDFANGFQPMMFVSAYNLTFADGRLYIGCYNGVTVAWSGGTLTHVAGRGTSLAEPEGSALGTTHNFGGTISDLCPAPGGGVIFTDGTRALLVRLDASNAVSVVAGVHGSMHMGEKALWFGADENSAPDEVAGWVNPNGYGAGWGQRLTSPPFSFVSHPNATLEFDIRLSVRSFLGFDLHETNFGDDNFFAVRGLKSDGTWAVLPIEFVHESAPSDQLGNGVHLTGTGVAHCRVDLTGASLADMTRLQLAVQTGRFANDEDAFSNSIAGALVLDNVRLTDSGDVLAPLDFEDGTTGAWALSALNAAYGTLEDGSQFFRDFPPPGTDVALRTGFDFSDPSCVWAFTSAGDSVPNGTYARLTSPWLALSDPDASTFLTFSGKLPTDNQKRYLKINLRTKDAGDTRPRQILFSSDIYSSGTSGSDLASPYLHRVTLQYPDDFHPGTEAGMYFGDSIQFVLQIEDRFEEQAASFPDPRVPSRLPYLDDLRVYQIAGDDDFDGVRNAEDACPTVSAEGRDADGDGCPDPTATLRHVESWDSGDRPIRVRITQNGDPEITDGSDLQAVRDAIAAWTGVPGADVPLVEDSTTVQTNAAAMDGVNLVTWDDELQFSPDILAVTPTTSFTQRGAFDDAIVLPGQIVDSDLIFNTAATYRTATTGPLPNSVDLQSVATHEIGHLLGISHSGVAEATMFPVLQSGTDAASLEDDDRAAIGAAYPGPLYATVFGAITGGVTRGSNAAPIPGALVTAWSLDLSNTPIRGVASDYTDENGDFALRGLAAGNYGIKVEPLDGRVPALIPAAINARVLEIAQTNFTAEWWSTGDDGVDDVEAITPITVVAGVVGSGHDVVTSIDVTPPEVTSVLPADGDGDVGITGRVLLNFSEPVEQGSLIDAFALRETGQPGRLGGQAQILGAGRTLIFTPDDILEFGTSYEIELTTELRDSQGVPSAAPFVTHFSTPAAPTVAIFDIQPRQAPPGALLTISGQGFSGNAEFEWQGAKGPVITSGGTITTPTTVVTRLDEFADSGPVRVIVGSDTSNAFNLTVLSPGPGVPTASGTPVALTFTPADVALSPEGLSAFATGDAGLATINLSPTRPNYRVADFQALPGARRIAMARDGRRAFVTRPDSSQLVEVDTDTTSAGFGHAFVRIALPGPPDGVFASPDGARAFVTEEAGIRVWTVDVDPSSATYRSVTREDTVDAVLTGGMGVSAETITSLATSPGDVAPRHPRALAEPFGQLFLTSTTGMVVLNLSSGSHELTDDRPCTDHLETTLDGNIAIAIGSGAAEGQLTRGCLSGNCFGVADPLATLGGRPRDLAANPRTGGLFVVNSLAGQLQVLNRSGNTFTLAGQAATGRTPVAVAVDASGAVTVVANSGDRTIGIYGVASSTDLASVQPSAAFPGDQVAVRLASGSAAGFAADLGAGPIAATNVRGEGLAFAVPELSPGTVNVSLESPTARTLSLPLDIVAPIETLDPRPTGQFMLAQFNQDDGDGPAESVLLTVSRDGRSMAVMTRVGDAFPAARLYQLRDDAPEPLYASLGDFDYIPYFEYPRDAAFSLDGRRLWTVTLAGNIQDRDADPASPFFGQSSNVGTASDAWAIAADPLSPRMFATVKALDRPYFEIWSYDESHTRVDTMDFSLTDSLLALAVSPDGRVLIVGGNGRARFVDPSTRLQFTGSKPNIHFAAGPVTSIATTGDGRRAVGIFRNGSFAVWSLEPGSEGEELHFGVVAPGVTPGRPIPGLDPHSVLAGGSDGNLYRIDVAGPVVVSSAPLSVMAPVIARTPDGRHLFAAGHNPGASHDTIRVYAMSAAAAMAIVSGGDQEALTGQDLPLPVRIHLSDALGRPQVGALVEFSVVDPTQGGLEGDLAVRRLTDVAGNAEVAWTMPVTPGAVSLTVRALGLPIAPLAVSARSSESAATAAPVITAFGPPNGATGIAAGGEVFVRFSQAMDSAQTVPFVTLRVGADVIPGAYRFDDGGRALFFKPSEPLPYLASCLLRVGDGALDAEGQALATADSSSFTIQAEPALTIAVLSPPAGSRGTTVTLNGQGFSPVPTLNVVRFNGTLASVVAASATTLIARVPSDATSGSVDVQVASVTSNGVPFVVLPPDPEPGTVLDTIPTPPRPLRLVVTPDGRRAYVVSPSTNTVGVLDIFFATDLAKIPVGSNPRDIAMLPDASRAYVANRDGGNVSVIGTAPEESGTYNRVIGSIKVGPQPVAIAAVYAGPRIVVVCEGDSSVKIIDAQRGNATFDQVIKSVPVPSGGSGVTVSPDGGRVFVGTGEGVSIIDLESYVVKSVPVPSGGGGVTVSPDGGLLFVITNDRHLVVIDVSLTSTTPNRVIKSVPLPSTGGSASVSPDGTLLFITLVDDGTVLVYVIGRGASDGDGNSTSPSPAVTLDLIATHPAGLSPAGMAVDPFGDFVLVANQGSDDLTVLLTNPALPSAVVEFPNGGETLLPGSEVTLSWSTDRFPLGQRVDLFLSRDNGSTWEPIAADLDNDGAHLWMVTGPPTVDGTAPRFSALLEVRVQNLFGIGGDRSDAPFTIYDASTPTLLVAFEARPAASGIEIRWQFSASSEVGAIRVERATATTGPWEEVQVALRAEGEATVALDATARPGRAYWYRISATLAEGGTLRSGTLSAMLPVLEFALEPVTPNPGSAPVAISFAVARATPIRLSVIDVSGRRVATLVDGVREAGVHRLVWDGTGSAGRLAAGLYFVRYEAAGKAFTRRFALTR